MENAWDDDSNPQDYQTRPDIITETVEETALNTGLPCSRNRCYEEGAGCAQCKSLVFRLPPEATVISARYYTTAGGDAGDTPLQEVQPGALPWAHFLPVRKGGVRDGLTDIVAVFINRKHDRHRIARVEIKWTLSPGDLPPLPMEAYNYIRRSAGAPEWA